MKLETFFEKFDQFADAPDAVAKMRELVLEISATGRLIPEALERPVKEDTRLMGTIVELVMGQAPKGNEYNTEGRGTVFVKVGEFGPLYPREEVWTTNPLKFAKKGDVLVCVVGATVGKLNLAIDCAIGRSAAAIRPSSALDTKFLYYSLIPYTLRLRRNSRGSAQGVIGKAELNAVSLWVPSREVQKLIVVKVDELMALCDRLALQQQAREEQASQLARAALARFADAPTPANLNTLFHSSFHIPPSDLRKSILSLAVQGKVVPQDPNDEPAETLVARIRGDHHAPKKGSIVEQFLIADDELPHEVPFGWSWSCVQELAQPNESVTYGILKPVWVESGVPTVRVTEMKTGVIDVSALPRCDPQRAAKFSKTTLKEGDLLISKDGTIGKTAFVPPELRGGNITQHMLRFAISKRLNRDFIRLCIDAPPCQAWMIGETKGVALQGVNVGDFRRMPIPLPPLAEQRRIVAKVEQLMTLVDELETQLAASRATAANLLSALVAELTTA